MEKQEHTLPWKAKEESVLKKYGEVGEVGERKGEINSDGTRLGW